MVELCIQLFETGLAEHKRRETEVNLFFSGQTKAVTDYQQKASQILANFEQQHKGVSCEGRNVLERLGYVQQTYINSSVNLLLAYKNFSCAHAFLEDGGVAAVIRPRPPEGQDQPLQ